MPDAPPRLDEYVLLGRSGVRVSRLCLGTMTVGGTSRWRDRDGSGRSRSRGTPAS